MMPGRSGLRRRIRDLIKRYHLIAIPCVFLADTLIGYQTYQKYVQRYGTSKKRIYYVEYRGVGDSYIACAILDDAGAIGADVVFLAPSKASEKAAALFPYGRIERITLKQAFAMREMTRFYGRDVHICPVIYESDPMVYSGVFRHMAGYKGLDFYFFMRLGLEVYANIRNDKRIGGIDKKRIANASDETINRIFQEKNLREGRTVLLAPYIGGHAFLVSDAVFPYIAAVLKKKGYDICTNSSDAEKEPVINGTIGVALNFRELISFCEKAGTFIGG